MKIGFFDSGLGGLTIMRAVREVLPQYDYLFYGDTLHVPFGDRNEEEIYELTKAAMRWLFLNDTKLAVIACNTASAETLRRLQDTFLLEEYPERRILGVIIPTIEEIIESGSKEALLIGTQRTIDSHKYAIELQKRNITDVHLRTLALPDLVPLIEAGKFKHAFELFLEQAEREMGEVDTLILGCTHYTTLKTLMRKRYGDALRVISQDELIPRKIVDYLLRHPEIETALTREGSEMIFLTKPEMRTELEQVSLLMGE